MLIMTVPHGIGEQQAPAFGVEADPPGNTSGPDKKCARRGALEHERGIVAFRLDQFPVMKHSRGLAPPGPGTVGVDGPELKGNNTVHVGAAFEHLT